MTSHSLLTLLFHGHFALIGSSNKIVKTPYIDNISFNVLFNIFILLAVFLKSM